MAREMEEWPPPAALVADEVIETEPQAAFPLLPTFVPILRFANPVMMRVAGKVQGGVTSEEWLYMVMRFQTNEAIVMRYTATGR